MQTSAMIDSATAMNVAEEGVLTSPDDVDAMLAAFMSKSVPATTSRQTRQKTPRFRVRWHVDILMDGHNIFDGLINDISTAGASILLAHNVHPLKPTLRIHIPPLCSTSKPHFMEVSGKTVYMVYDGGKQLYRASISFTKFHAQTDMAFLEERLNKHHSRIPEH